MKRQRDLSITAALLLFGALCLVPCLQPGSAHAASVNIGFNVVLPPAYRMVAPPPMAVIPGSYVYVVPDIDVDILFFHGTWYRPHQGNWFRASSYNGPWRFVASDRVPRQVVELPRYDYRRIPPGHDRISHKQFKKNWKKWENRRHWEKNRAWHETWQRRDNRENHFRDQGPGARDRDHRQGAGDDHPRGHGMPDRGHERP